MTLGHRTLRADAVPIAAISVLQFLWGDCRQSGSWVSWNRFEGLVRWLGALRTRLAD